jgi:tetratricopeptide (TPR) repeat protein
MTALPSARRLLGPARIRPLGVVLAAVILAVGSYVGAGLIQVHPARPTVNHGAPLAVPAVQDAASADLDDIDAQLRIWAPKAAADARDDISAGNVAILYLSRGRVTGDAADYERALAAADRAVSANPASTGTRTLKATVLQATHDFPGALALATSILAEEPGNVDAIVVSGDAELELGRLADAAAAYRQAGAVIPGAALDARLARLAWLSGDAGAGIRLATQARDEAGGDDELSDPSFYPAQLGEMARITGDEATARAAFAEALGLRPTNQLALLGRARLEAHDGADAAAIADLRTAAAIAPRPETLALLTDLLDRTGDAAGARAQAETIAVIERLGGTTAQLFDRQIIGFDLDHGRATPAVLDRARAAADVRPDAPGLDLVAWAAYRLGDLDTARAESARAMATGSIDARILYHAGAIAIASGDDGGRTLVQRAVDLGPALDPLDHAAAEALLRG